MNAFLQRRASSVMGMISGWDRLRFRGTLRMLAHVTGLLNFLCNTRRLLKDFGQYALPWSRVGVTTSRATAPRDDWNWSAPTASASTCITTRSTPSSGSCTCGYNIPYYWSLDQSEWASDDPAERRRRSGQITRRIRMLRAHGLIHKVPHTHRHMVSKKGRRVTAAVHAAREADIEKLSKAA